VAGMKNEWTRRTDKSRMLKI